jgi:hypothetical protein
LYGVLNLLWTGLDFFDGRLLGSAIYLDRKFPLSNKTLNYRYGEFFLTGVSEGLKKVLIPEELPAF